ncbi:MAG: addiction module protein [Nitrospirae bacterium]|nr:addiction module protein [Nitrospirota bacterium]
MSTTEKLRAMESLWDDLCQKAGDTLSPAWHQITF